MTTELKHVKFKGHLVSPLLPACRRNHRAQLPSPSRPRDFSKSDEIARFKERAHKVRLDRVHRLWEECCLFWCKLPTHLRRAPHQNTRKGLVLLLQLNPVLGMAPNISMETNVRLKLLLKSFRSLLGSRTYLQPTTSLSKETPARNAAPAMPWPGPVATRTWQERQAHQPPDTNWWPEQDLEHCRWAEMFSSHPPVPAECLHTLTPIPAVAAPGVSSQRPWGER